MPRDANKCEFVRMVPTVREVSDWEAMDYVYPKKQAYSVQRYDSPDPFSPEGSGRIITRTEVMFQGFGYLDLGWIVPGEPPPVVPAAAMWGDPGVMAMFAENWSAPCLTQGDLRDGVLWRSWTLMHGVMALTLVGLTIQLAEMLRWPAWSLHLRKHAEELDFANGVVVKYRNSPMDLRTVFDPSKK